MKLAKTACAIVAGAVATIAVVDVLLMRRAVLPSRPRLISALIDEAAGTVTVPYSSTTSLPGEFGLWVNGGRGHVRVGEILSSAPDDVVVRRIVDVSGNVTNATEGRWTGHVFAHAINTGLPYEDVDIPAGDANLPAWLFPGSEGQPWAIHLHGIKSSRASALRSVPAAEKLGMTSLVPSFYGEYETNESRPPGATLGIRETADVDRAIEYAVSQGAERIVLFGWSMGATIALRLSKSSRHRDRMTDLVLIGPVLNWSSSIRRGMRAARVPLWLAPVVLWSLESPSLSRLAKMASPTELSALNWTDNRQSPEVPTLVLHSSGDQDSSLSETVALAQANPLVVAVEEFSPVPHLMEWNVYPDQFERAVMQRLSRRN